MIVLLAGMLPAFYLIYKIYKLDRIEKEPVGLLVKLFFLGGLSIIPAVILEEIGSVILYMFLDETSVLYILLENFIVVAISEEFCKRWFLQKTTRKHPAFNYRFDAVVYAVTVSLGFAAFENVMYIMDFGLSIAPVRALTSVPLHGICGVFMGFFYGSMKANDGWNQQRYLYAKKMSLWVPVLIHGFYDFCASMEEDSYTLIWLAFIVILYIFVFRFLKNISRNDAPV